MDRRFNLSQKQLNRAQILERLKSDPGFTIPEAAIALGLSERQVQRLKGAYSKNGINALAHKNIGRIPAHAMTEETRQVILKIKKSPVFKKANFKHFQEILAREKFGIKICYSSLYGILTSEGIKSPKTRRPAKMHRRRIRKAREGLMLQMDASPFTWFNNEQSYSLHGAIDDATGKIVALYLCKNECLQGYFEIMRRIVMSNGIPVSLYADRHTIFLSPKGDKLTVEEQINGVVAKDTQFGRAIKQLGITLIKARSAQAKGRVERLWGTLQSRLPIEFMMEDITTVDTANAFLANYISEYNDQFAVVPEDSQNIYRSVSPALRLENILCISERRMFDKGGVFSFRSKLFKIISDQNDRVLPCKGGIDVLASPFFGIRACFGGITYNVEPFVRPEKLVNTEPKKKYIPESSHYYKYGHDLLKKTRVEETNYEILSMLEKMFLSSLPDYVPESEI